MKRLLSGFVLVVAAAGTATAGSKLEAKLSAEVDKQGHVTTTLEVTNNGNRPICFLAGETLVRLQSSGGEALGNPGTVDFVRPDSVDVIWDGGFPQTFPLPVDGWYGSSGNIVLSPDEIRSFVKATTYLNAFDCTDFLANKGNAKPKIQRDLSATPTFAP